MKQRAVYQAPAWALACALSVFWGGCSTKQGATPDNRGDFVSLAAVQKMKPATPVAVRGTMIKKCPVAGCWFILSDDTGTIKVDLKATKQTVVSISLNTQATIRGTVALDGSHKMIRAVSAAF
ncbi:MAG TPA: hypothetical protein VGB77_17260 [Abditibacteriaceae bacterium]|jgi:uncharacterized protein YdeI (BOF family)